MNDDADLPFEIDERYLRELIEDAHHPHIVIPTEWTWSEVSLTAQEGEFAPGILDPGQWTQPELTLGTPIEKIRPRIVIPAQWLPSELLPPLPLPMQAYEFTAQQKRGAVVLAVLGVSMAALICILR